jgi:hypothetical protein
LCVVGSERGRVGVEGVVVVGRGYLFLFNWYGDVVGWVVDSLLAVTLVMPAVVCWVVDTQGTWNVLVVARWVVTLVMPAVVCWVVDAQGTWNILVVVRWVITLVMPAVICWVVDAQGTWNILFVLRWVMCVTSSMLAVVRWVTEA